MGTDRRVQPNCWSAASQSGCQDIAYNGASQSGSSGLVRYNRRGGATDMPIQLIVNGQTHLSEAAADTALLYVLRNDLRLNGPQFGCGQETCGACMVLVGARARMACRLPLSEVGGAAITTLEGLSAAGELHPLQQAFIEQQAAQCGYCSNGMLISAAALLWKTPRPTQAQVRAALDGNLCRCGSHTRILRAVLRAAELLAEGAA